MSRSRVLVCAVALLGAVALLVFLNARAHRGRSAGTAVEKLIGDLSSPDVATRASAARRLGEMGPRAASAVPALAALLGDQSEVGDGDLLGEKAGRALGKVGGPAADALLEAVSSKDPYVRNAAIQGLAFTTDSRATGPLHKALHDAVERVRWSAALSLGYRNDRTAASELVALLRSDRSATVRGAAATTLGVTKTKGSVDGLVAALRDRDASVRESAALGLGSIGDPRGVPPLIALLRDKMPGVRLAATGSLGAFTADPRVLEPLIGALRDEEIGDIGGGEAWGRSKIGSVAAGALAKSRDLPAERGLASDGRGH